MNFIKIIFAFFTIHIAITGGLIYYFHNYLPLILRRLFLFGKYAEEKQSRFVSKLEISKRCFQHFYIFATPLSTYALFLAWNQYFYNERIPSCIYLLLDLLLGNNRKPVVSPANSLLALSLLIIQCLKRLYETHAVNVFSDAKINLSHYIVGFVHYIGVVAVSIGESKGFIKGSEVKFQNSLRTKDLIGTLFFFWMAYQQLKSNFILSKLRKNEKGVVMTKGYKIPVGGLFDFITSPLQFCEIGMYIALQIILWESRTYPFICSWVVVNQFVCALFSQQWHRKTFKDYPLSRKIIIPYIL